MVFVLQNIIVLWIGTSLKESFLNSQELTIPIQNLNH